MLGDCEVAVAGGAESMSRAAYFLPAGRWGQRMGDANVVDAMTGALHDPFGHGHMGVTAENIAAKYGFTREQQDEFSIQSHQKAAEAMDAGYFKSQIIADRDQDEEGRRAVRHRRARPQGHQSGGHGQAQDRLQEGRHGNRRERLGHQRRGRGYRSDYVRTREEERAEADGASGRVFACRRRAAGDGPRADPGGEEGVREIGPQARRHGRGGVERGVRGAGDGGDQGPRPRPGPGQPERRRGGARPPDRRHRRDPHRQGALRARAHAEAPRAGHHVHRRRPGHRGDLRKV